MNINQGICMNNKITEFSIFGSCTSRTLFNSNVNKDYKKYFSINKSVESSTLISLMSKPVKYDPNTINSDSKYDNICINDDLSKNFLELVKKDYVDYIIIDTLFDVASSVLFYDKDCFITLNGRLMKTDFYNEIKYKRHINIFDNFEEYYQMWTDACNKFFNFVESNCDHTKIILNCSRSAYEYLDKNGNILKNAHFEQVSNKFNPFQNLLDKYILKNFDVEVMEFRPNTLLDENHNFGLHPNHYEQAYYHEKNQQLLQIINRNANLSFNSEENILHRKMQKEKLIKTFEKTHFAFNDRIDIEHKKRLIEDSVENKLNKYNTARIDIKNRGTKENTVKINNYSDFNLVYYYPTWFKTNTGKGLVINSEKNFLKFDLTIEGDGELQIYLRSLDFRINTERQPIFIKYTKFCINDADILNENKIVYHDKPYIHKIDVKDKEKLTLYMEWLPC